ncbi:hypothetical protein ACLPHD_12635 [Serratia odorifera]|uniref:hypothetical protein n=1 Tax=Serratia odorifera TaxID=618 RepID=UPI003D2784D0
MKNNSEKSAFPLNRRDLPSGMSYRQYLIAQMAPAALTAFYEHDAWEDYQDMAKSLMCAVNELLQAEAHQVRERK